MLVFTHNAYMTLIPLITFHVLPVCLYAFDSVSRLYLALLFLIIEQGNIYVVCKLNSVVKC